MHRTFRAKADASVVLKFGNKEAADFEELVDSFPSAAFGSPRRSTVPLLDFMRSPQDRLRELAHTTGLDLSPPAELSFEYAVPVRKGRGKASFTDLHILTTELSVAVEAKYTEPMYEDVRTWLRNPPKDNRRLVLEGWLELITQTTGCGLPQRVLLDLPYQLLHRTASACFSARAGQAVIYLVFGKDSAKCYEKPIRALAELLGSDTRMQFHLVECGIDKRSSFGELEKRWKQKDEGIGDAVRTALKNSTLFSFDGLNPVYPLP